MRQHALRKLIEAIPEDAYPSPIGWTAPPTWPRLNTHLSVAKRLWALFATLLIMKSKCHPRSGVGLNHLPSGRFCANGAWLAVQVLAHNLARWAARIGLGEQLVTTKTLRRRFFSMAGRLTRSARRLTLHLPRGWPWEEQFSRALARLRALPLPS